MTWDNVCDAWDAGSSQTFEANYGREGHIKVRPMGDEFEYMVVNHETQGSKPWARQDRWYRLAAVNGDFNGMDYTPER